MENLKTLFAALLVPDDGARIQAEDALKTWSEHPNFVTACADVLSDASATVLEKQTVSIYLKNYFFTTLDPETVSQEQVLASTKDKDALLRLYFDFGASATNATELRTVANLKMAVVRVGEFLFPNDWPALTNGLDDFLTRPTEFLLANGFVLELLADLVFYFREHFENHEDTSDMQKEASTVGAWFGTRLLEHYTNTASVLAGLSFDAPTFAGVAKTLALLESVVCSLLVKPLPAFVAANKTLFAQTLLVTLERRLQAFVAAAVGFGTAKTDTETVLHGLLLASQLQDYFAEHFDFALLLMEGLVVAVSRVTVQKTAADFAPGTCRHDFLRLVLHAAVYFAASPSANKYFSILADERLLAELFDRLFALFFTESRDGFVQQVASDVGAFPEQRTATVTNSETADFVSKEDKTNLVTALENTLVCGESWLVAEGADGFRRNEENCRLSFWNKLTLRNHAENFFRVFADRSKVVECVLRKMLVATFPVCTAADDLFAHCVALHQTIGTNAALGGVLSNRLGPEEKIALVEKAFRALALVLCVAVEKSLSFSGHTFRLAVPLVLLASLGVVAADVLRTSTPAKMAALCRNAANNSLALAVLLKSSLAFRKALALLLLRKEVDAATLKVEDAHLSAEVSATTKDFFVHSTPRSAASVAVVLLDAATLTLGCLESVTEPAETAVLQLRAVLKLLDKVPKSELTKPVLECAFVATERVLQSLSVLSANGRSMGEALLADSSWQHVFFEVVCLLATRTTEAGFCVDQVKTLFAAVVACFEHTNKELPTVASASTQTMAHFLLLFGQRNVAVDCGAVLVSAFSFAFSFWQTHATQTVFSVVPLVALLKVVRAAALVDKRVFVAQLDTDDTLLRFCRETTQLVERVFNNRVSAKNKRVLLREVFALAVLVVRFATDQVVAKQFLSELAKLIVFRSTLETTTHSRTKQRNDSFNCEIVVFVAALCEALGTGSVAAFFEELQQGLFLNWFARSWVSELRRLKFFRKSDYLLVVKSTVAVLRDAAVVEALGQTHVQTAAAMVDRFKNEGMRSASLKQETDVSVECSEHFYSLRTGLL